MTDKKNQLKQPVSTWMKGFCIALFALVGILHGAQAQLLWSDEFNSGSTPDANVWTAELGDGSQYGIPGWGNSELQNYTGNAANVRVADGNLVITAIRTGNSFTSARIKTQNKLTFKYGTVEARIKTPDLANGLWPAFWTLGNDWQQGQSWPDCGEIDIMEMGNKNAITAGVVNRRVGSHLHWDNNGSYAGDGDSHDMPLPINDTFVIYRMEWTPTQVRTYINGINIWTMNTGSIPEFNEPHFLLFNLAVGGTYTGRTTPSQITALASGESAEYVIDYIRIYQNGHTVLDGTALTSVPPVFTTDPIIRANATQSSAYNATIAGSATDANAGDTLTYSKVPGSGPAWLNVAPGGTLYGTPGNDDVGLNSWTVEVSDGFNSPVSATLEIMVDNVNDAPEFTTDPIIMPNGYEGSDYTGSIAGSATDVDTGDSLSYSKFSGPLWLNIATNGVLSGTPTVWDVGQTNTWTVWVSDSNGSIDSAKLKIFVDNELAPPVLSIQLSGSNLEILWPSSTSGFSLYSSTNLIPNTLWSAVTNTPVIQGDDWMVIMPISEAPQYFRLVNP